MIASTRHRERLNALYQLRFIRDYDRPQQIECMDRPGETAFVVWIKKEESE